MGKVYTVAILGCGSRGAFAYGEIMVGWKDKYEIVALCDVDEGKLGCAAAKFGVAKEKSFLTEEGFFEEKHADVLVIATQDRDHVRHAIRALELGYHILLEKPISPIKEELYVLLEAQKKYQREVLVCHVLRYAPAYVKIKELIDSGVIGKLVRMEATEMVRYAHQSHSFVRGNWRREEETSPMIMAKCCHDLDMIQYYIGSTCESVYSNGDLRFFKEENQPEGAADRCQDCQYKTTCPYSAELQYVQAWKEGGCRYGWPYNVVDPLNNPYTEETLRAAYEKGPYGRCVFKCDNDVVDNQMVAMNFKNGVYATLVMTAFTGKGGRIYTFHGTHGEIRFDDGDEILRLFEYNGLEIPKTTTWNVKELVNEKVNKGFGHGGGDMAMLLDLYDLLEGKGKGETTLEKSMESHLMALAAEESRKSGQVVKVHK